MQALFAPDPLVRLPLYAIIGLVAEVVFTASQDLLNPMFLRSWNVFGHASLTERPDWRPPGRDLRAMGYTFLWMIPIYMLMILLEPIQPLLSSLPFLLRGFFYIPLVWIAEYACGALIRALIGRCPWDYSYSRFSFHGLIRWDFAHVWYFFGLIFEYLFPRIVALTPAIRAVFIEGKF